MDHSEKTQVFFFGGGGGIQVIPRQGQIRDIFLRHHPQFCTIGRDITHFTPSVEAEN